MADLADTFQPPEDSTLKLDASPLTYTERCQCDLADAVSLLSSIADQLPPDEGAKAYLRMGYALQRIDNATEATHGWRVCGELTAENILLKTGYLPSYGGGEFSQDGERVISTELGKIQLNIISLTEKDSEGAPLLIQARSQVEGQQIYKMKLLPENNQLLIEVGTPYTVPMQFGDKEYQIPREAREVQFLSLAPGRLFEIERRVLLSEGSQFPKAHDSKGGYAAVCDGTEIKILNLNPLTNNSNASEVSSISAELYGRREIKYISFSRDASKIVISSDYGLTIVGPPEGLLVDDFADLVRYRD